MPPSSLQHTIPVLSMAVLTLLAALPWGLPPGARFFLPLLPYVAIHFWLVRRPGLMPEWAVFLAGLTTDVLTHGPLGFWSLVYLLGYLTARALPQSVVTTTLQRFANFCLTLGVLALAQWTIASVYFVDYAEWRPVVSGTLAAILAYPVVGLIFRPLSLLWMPRDSGQLMRGN